MYYANFGVKFFCWYFWNFWLYQIFVIFLSMFHHGWLDDCFYRNQATYIWYESKSLCKLFLEWFEFDTQLKFFECSWHFDYGVKSFSFQPLIHFSLMKMLSTINLEMKSLKHDFLKYFLNGFV
jgi:hypothetical protein